MLQVRLYRSERGPPAHLQRAAEFIFNLKEIILALGVDLLRVFVSILSFDRVCFRGLRFFPSPAL